MTLERLDNIDTRIDRLASIMEASDQRLSQKLEALTEQIGRVDQRLGQKLEILTEQVGRFTEGLTEIRLTAERQERNIDRLVGVVETLIQRGG